MCWKLTRSLTGYALAGLILVTLATVSIYFVLVSELEKSTQLFLGDKLHVLRTMLRERPEDTDALREEVELETAARRYEHFYIRLLNERNTSFMTTPGMAEELDLSQLARLTRGHPGVLVTMKGRHGQALRVTTASAPVGSPPTRTFTILIAIDVSQKEAFLAHFRLVFWVIILGTLTIFPLIGYQIARQGIRPVEEMAATARRISSTHLGERILTEGYPSELASLAGTFNEMLDRLQDSFDRVSRFSADIAHDLRTPVNNIRGEAEVALARARTIDEYRDALESSLEEAVRLSDLIGNLLFLARAESPLAHLRRERVDVAELLDGVQQYYEASAADGEIGLTTRFGDEPVIAELDRTLMQRAVGNLVSNAMAHTLCGGSVVMTAISENALVRIEVIDTGIGIPSEAVPRVFDRFFRVDPSRSQASGGTGLGLAIVQGIMQLHGGKVEIISRSGEGTRVILSMPASAPKITRV
jgi:two-component system heavy metal sensor histidine kinase CusS